MKGRSWAEWFAAWCVERGVLTAESVRSVQNTDFYVVARRLHAKRNESDRVIMIQLDGALREMNGASRTIRCRA